MATHMASNSAAWNGPLDWAKKTIGSGGSCFGKATSLAISLSRHSPLALRDGDVEENSKIITGITTANSSLEIHRARLRRASTATAARYAAGNNKTKSILVIARMADARGSLAKRNQKLKPPI